MSFDRLSLFPISLSPGVRHGPSGAPEASRCELPGPCTHQHEPFQPAPGAEACGRARRESDDGDLQRRTSVTSLSQMNSQTSASSPREWFHSRCGKDQETVGRTTIGGTRSARTVRGNPVRNSGRTGRRIGRVILRDYRIDNASPPVQSTFQTRTLRIGQNSISVYADLWHTGCDVGGKAQ